MQCNSMEVTQPKSKTEGRYHCEFAEERYQFVMKPTKKNGRNTYTASEDKAITDFVKKNCKDKGQFSVNGNALYKMMEAQKVTRHPWQSMRSRFLKLNTDLTARFEFHQMIRAKSKDKEIPVLTHAVRKSEFNADGEVRNKATTKQPEPFDGLKNDEDDADSDDSLTTRGKIIQAFLRRPEGKELLRRILVQRRIQDFVISSGLDFNNTVKLIFGVNGNLTEADYYMKNGEMTDGNKLWTEEEDEILIEEDQNEIDALSEKRGKQAVTARQVYLTE